MKNNCLGFLIIYCSIFVWLAVPFVMADDTSLRKYDLSPASKADTVTPKETVTASVDTEDLSAIVIVNDQRVYRAEAARRRE
jgi:hypothetical protein